MPSSDQQCMLPNIYTSQLDDLTRSLFPRVLGSLRTRAHLVSFGKNNSLRFSSAYPSSRTFNTSTTLRQSLALTTTPILYWIPPIPSATQAKLLLPSPATSLTHSRRRRCTSHFSAGSSRVHEYAALGPMSVHFARSRSTTILQHKRHSPSPRSGYVRAILVLYDLNDALVHAAFETPPRVRIFPLTPPFLTLIFRHSAASHSTGKLRTT